MADKKMRSLWPWSKPQQDGSGSNTTPPDVEDVLSDEYESEKEEKNPAILKSSANKAQDLISRGSGDGAGFDIDEVERLLRDNNIGHDISSCDTLAGIVNHYAHFGGHVERNCKQLTACLGDALFAEDTNGSNAAHRACIYGWQDIVTLLFLDEMAQCRPEIIGRTAGEAYRKRTYLHLAAKKKWHRVVEWLLERNASMDQKDMDGKTAWDVAFEKNDGVVMSMIATRLVGRQIDTGEAKPNEIKGNSAKSAKVEIDPGQGEKIRGSKVRRHWFRMNSGCRCGFLMKLSGLPNESDKGINAYIPFKLFTISRNNHICSLALLRSICEKEKFDDEKTRKYLSFVQNHFRDPSILFPRFPPTAVFEDFWWTLGRSRNDSDEHMGMTSIAMPYLYSVSWRSVGNRRNLHEGKTASTICPAGKYSRHGLLLPLTLDEYCNPSLSDETLSMRNADQVVVRAALRHHEEGEEEDVRPTRIKPTSIKEIRPNTRLLMVHQCWIYRLNGTHILSFPEVLLRQAEIMSALKYLFQSDSIFDDYVNSIFDIQSTTSIARWLNVFIGLSETPIGLGKPVLDIFEESISVISNDVDQYFNKKTPRQQEKAAKDEKEFFHDIADIRGELSMLRSVTTQQEQVWTALKARLLSLIDHLDGEHEFPHKQQAHTQVSLSANSRVQSKAGMMTGPQTEGKTETKHGPLAFKLYLERRASANRIVEETSSLLQRFKDRIEKVDQDAERVQNLVPQYLELKRSYASIKESHYTAILGAAVFGLSVVTIVFTPLSFAVALLALPNDSVYLKAAADMSDKKSTIVNYTVGAEFVTLGLTSLVALLAVWWFRNTSVLRGDKDKNKVKEIWMKRSGDRNHSAISEAKAQGVVTTGSSSSQARSSREASNPVDAPTTAPQSADGGAKKQSENVARPQTRRQGYASDDVEQGLGAGVGTS